MSHESSGLNTGPNPGVDVNATLSQIAEILRSVTSASLQLHTRFDPNPGRIDAAQQEINWLFVNLMTGAYDTLRKGGLLMIKTSQRDLDAAAASELELAPGGYVQVELITSSGGRSAGPAALEMVRQIGGGIREEAVPENGKTITVLLPQIAW
jgi:hypothetical protein